MKRRTIRLGSIILLALAGLCFPGEAFAQGGTWTTKAPMPARTIALRSAAGLPVIAHGSTFADGLRLPETAPAQAAPADRARIDHAYGKLPISLTANHGQADAQVDFISRGSGYTLFQTPFGGDGSNSGTNRGEGSPSSRRVAEMGRLPLSSEEDPGQPGAQVRRDGATRAADPRALPPGLFLALAETRQREGGAAYAFRPVAGRDGAYQAANRAQQFETTFGPDGVRLTPTVDRETAAVTLRLAAVTPESRVRRLPSSPLDRLTVPRAGRRTEGREGWGLVSEAWHLVDARVVRHHRTADGWRVAEWYINSLVGLEQGFTILDGDPNGADTVRLTMEMGGSALVALDPDGDAVVITDPSGQLRLAYGPVDAWDAAGRRLPARLEPAASALSLVVTTRDAHYPLTIDPIIEQAKLTASDGAGDDWFGYTVALSGDTALVGAIRDDVGANTNQGSAYVFTRSGGVWTQQAQLTASDGAGGDLFGFVALSGDTALVGAIFDDVGANTDQGSAYVFTRNGGVWTEQAHLIASDGAAGDQLGGVALDGDTAVVGAARADVGANGDQGAAYVFTRTGGVWTQQTKLTANDGAVSDLFGFTVAVSGDTVLVSAIFDDVGPHVDQGSAYVFTRSGGLWTQQAHLTVNDLTVQLGHGVAALSGDTALLGALFDNSAYVFIRSGGVWTQQAKLAASDAAPGDHFGHGGALSGDTLLVGAHEDDVGPHVNQGSAYVFTRSGGVWTQQAKLIASDGAAFDQFGNHMALSGQTALVGARFANVGSNVDQGAAYVFTGLPTNTPPTITSLAATPNVLWPPNNRLVPVSLAVAVTDPSDPAPVCQVTSVQSSEPTTSAPDAVITGPLTVSLRAQRAGAGTGRVYTVTVTCTNTSHLSATKTVGVSVPHDRR